jgi:hypothetical protein
MRGGPEKMAKKTRTRLENELAAARREEKWAQGQLHECQARNRILSADIESQKMGWAIDLRGQVRRGSYSDMKALVTILVDNGFWFFDLKKD